jgi:TP53 regulating kinase-like protein
LAKLIKKGAEADILLGDWHSILSIFKVRKRRSYMLPELDEALRHQRTIREAELIKEAKELNVPTPRLYFVNLKDSTIIMEYVKGNSLKSMLDKKTEAPFWFKQVGIKLGNLHEGGIIHGDPTPGNFIISNRKLITLDFGLSFRSLKIEDRAVDLHLMKEVLAGCCPAEFLNYYNNFLAGYTMSMGDHANEVIRHVQTIERRGRYARAAWLG